MPREFVRKDSFLAWTQTLGAAGENRSSKLTVYGGNLPPRMESILHGANSEYVGNNEK
jgi:hypothetical protein